MANLTLPIVRAQVLIALGTASRFFTGSAEIHGEAEAQQTTNNNLNQIISQGLTILNGLKPLRGEVILNLIANKNRYDLPNTVLNIISHQWGQQQLVAFKPWQPSYPKNIPNVRYDNAGSTGQAVLNPPPSSLLLNSLGSFMPLSVAQRWTITENGDNTTVDDRNLDRVILACRAAAMLNILTSRAGDPLKNQQSKNLNPQSAYNTLMQELNTWAMG